MGKTEEAKKLINEILNNVINFFDINKLVYLKQMNGYKHLV